MHSTSEPERRHVRSYVRRAGRITSAQARALKELWPKYGVDYSPQAVDLNVLFGRTAPRLLEIGFGNGEVLAAVAAQRRDWDCIGIEVHEPGVGRVLLLGVCPAMLQSRLPASRLSAKAKREKRTLSCA